MKLHFQGQIFEEIILSNVIVIIVIVIVIICERLWAKQFLSGDLWHLNSSLFSLHPSKPCWEKQQGILGKAGGGLYFPFKHKQHLCVCKSKEEYKFQASFIIFPWE